MKTIAFAAMIISFDVSRPDPVLEIPMKSIEIQQNLDRIQGNILEGFNKDFQAFLFLRVTDPTAAKGWLAGLVEEIASVEEVREFNNLFKKLVRRRGGELGILKATWMNLAFTFRGLQTLGLPAAE